MTLSLLTACRPAVTETVSQVDVEVDGRILTFQIQDNFTVEAFLNEFDIEYEPTDRIVPQLFTQVSDGMRITIRRVTETEECIREEVPYQEIYVPNEGLQPDEERVMREGNSGLQETCYRIILEDGVEASRQPISQPQLIREPVDKLIVVGIDTEVEPIPINGTLAYINNNNAWVIQGNSQAKRPLTTTGNLDGLVMDLSEDGQYLIYTRKPSDPELFVNELWLIDTRGDRSPVQLVPTDVLWAEWIPNQTNTISYSTSEVQSFFPFWKALNNVWNVQIDPLTGRSLNPIEVVRESTGGLDGWWGTVYKWSPDGNTLAWARADSVGTVSENGDLDTLTNYALFRTSQNWSWRANLSWSPDSQFITTAVHGPPIGREQPERSPLFNLAVLDSQGSFETVLTEGAGMWSSPLFSPVVGTGENARVYIAYLKSRDPYSSVTGEYDLVVADADGSNARVIFPTDQQRGITTQVQGLTTRDYVWSPDATQIAIVHQGNLWVVNVNNGIAHQLTFDGQSKYPIWAE